ncbi:MAG TPA: DUF6701 domain-containing protein [Gammaproteobacteria bacterium]|nr:DUF6701 domain-containing protein [Gammaproteobacteria bacterium]
MKKIAWTLMVFILLFLNTRAAATQCTSAFPAAIQSTLPATGKVTFTCGSRVTSNSTPTDSLPTPTLTNPVGCVTNTCPNANCTATGATVGTISPGAFQASSGAGGNVTVSTNNTQTIGGSDNTTTDYNAISVSPHATLNFSTKPSGSTIYRINSLDLNNNSTVNFQGGDYWIGTLTISGGQAKNITTTGTTRLFIGSDVGFSTGLTWNTMNTADKFFIYAYGNFNITAPSTIRAIIYSQKNVTLGSTTLTGAVTAQNITLNNNSTVAYDAAAVNNLDFGFVCSPTSQLAVSAPATGTHCQGMAITVAAQNANAQTITNYTDSITLNTQTGAGMWVSTSGGGAFSDNANNGLATYTFVAGDNGSASFQLNYPASGSAPVTIKASQTNNAGIFGLSNSINFVPASLLVTDTPVSNFSDPPPAFATPQTAGTNFTLHLTAYNPGNCGVVTSYSGTKNIRFYTTYVNPTTGTINAKINGATIANSVDAVATTQPITFTNGMATITNCSYDDVGKLQLNVIDTATNPAGPSGASGDFVVKPASFTLNVPNNAASQTQTATACLANNIFKKAGNNFTVNVQARNSSQGVTPNYGNETPKQGIMLTSGAIYGPTNARNGSTGVGAIRNGDVIEAFTKIISGGAPANSGWPLPYFQGTTFSFDEVGCINLTASVLGGSYLDVPSSATGNLVIGRFTPDHFDASGLDSSNSPPQFKTACSNESSGFTYLDQPFLYARQPVLTVTARALGGTITQNYTGSFWKLSSNGFASVYNKAYFPVNLEDTIPSLILSPLTPPPPTFIDVGGGVAIATGAGTGTFTFSDGGGLKIQRLSGTLVPPFTVEIQLRVETIKDADNVLCTGTGCSAGGLSFGETTLGNGIVFSGGGGGKQFYHGRLVLIDASGPETFPLLVPMQTQFYITAGGFILNTIDTGSSGNCTAYPYTENAKNLNLTTSSGLSTTATLAGSPPYYFSGGTLNVSLSPPTGTTTGYADIEATLQANTGANLPWLQYNWPYAGSAGIDFRANPRGRGTFGIFKGNDRVIYQKEITQ